jgi:hypothetical protein
MTIKYGQVRGASNYSFIEEGLEELTSPEGYPLFALASCPERLWKSSKEIDRQEQDEYMEMCWDVFDEWRDATPACDTPACDWYDAWELWGETQSVEKEQAETCKDLWLSGASMS